MKYEKEPSIRIFLDCTPELYKDEVEIYLGIEYALINYRREPSIRPPVRGASMDLNLKISKHTAYRWLDRLSCEAVIEVLEDDLNVMSTNAMLEVNGNGYEFKGGLNRSDFPDEVDEVYTEITKQAEMEAGVG